MRTVALNTFGLRQPDRERSLSNVSGRRADLGMGMITALAIVSTVIAVIAVDLLDRWAAPVLTPTPRPSPTATPVNEHTTASAPIPIMPPPAVPIRIAAVGSASQATAPAAVVPIVRADAVRMLDVRADAGPSATVVAAAEPRVVEQPAPPSEPTTPVRIFAKGAVGGVLAVPSLAALVIAPVSSPAPALAKRLPDSPAPIAEASPRRPGAGPLTKSRGMLTRPRVARRTPVRDPETTGSAPSRAIGPRRKPERAQPPALPPFSLPGALRPGGS